MRHLIAVIVLVLASNWGADSALFSRPLSAHGNHAPKLEVVRPWARETSKSAPSAAVYMELTYLDDHADTLVGASTRRANMVMIHDTVTENNVAMMREADPIKLTNGTTVSFVPGGKHIMLIGLSERLKKGETFDLILHFEDADDVTIKVEVTPVTGPE